jgi:hypothetical protein
MDVKINILYSSDIDNIYLLSDNNDISFVIALNQEQFDQIYDFSNFYAASSKGVPEEIKHYITETLIRITAWLCNNMYSERYFEMLYHPYKSYYEFFSMWNKVLYSQTNIHTEFFKSLKAENFKIIPQNSQNLFEAFHFNYIYPYSLFLLLPFF